MKSASKSKNHYEIHREPIDITPTKEPNPNWKYKCKCGRTYTWKNPPKFISINTLVDLACPHFVCHDCDESIPTGSMFKSPKWKEYIAGPTEYRINSELVIKEEFIKVFKKDHPNIKI